MNNFLVISETKLEDSFPSAQFSLPNYKIRARRDRDKNGGGLINLLRRILSVKNLKTLSLGKVNAFVLKFLYLRRDGCALSIYRPPSYDNLELYIDKLTTSYGASGSYENFIGDFNVEVTNKGIKFDKLDKFCDLFYLTNLVTSPTCFTKTLKSIIDLILTNKGNCFQETKVIETSLTDLHTLISSFLRSHFGLRNRFYKTLTEENGMLYKKQRNKCVSIRKKIIRNYFNKIANGNIVTIRNF